MDSGRAAHKVGATALAALALQALAVVPRGEARAAEEAPKLTLIPFGHAKDVPEATAGRFVGMLTDELKTRAADFQWTPPAPSTAPAPRPPALSKEAADALAEGARQMEDGKFEEAAASLQKGIDSALAAPAVASDAIEGALVQLASAYFRLGEEKKAQEALFTLCQLNPDYQLPPAKFPPVFARELEKAKRRAERSSKPKLPARVVVQPAPPAAPEETPRLGPVFNAESMSKLARLCKRAGADFALVGWLARSAERQLTLRSALYSVQRGGLARLPVVQVDDGLQVANAEGFKLVDAVVARAKAFDAPDWLPMDLSGAAPPTAFPSASVPAVPVPVARAGAESDVPKRPAPHPEGASVEVKALHKPAAAESSTFAAESEKHVKSGGVPGWVWVVAGVAVVAAGGATAYGVVQATSSPSGTVTAKW